MVYIKLKYGMVRFALAIVTLALLYIFDFIINNRSLLSINEEAMQYTKSATNLHRVRIRTMFLVVERYTHYE